MLDLSSIQRKGWKTGVKKLSVRKIYANFNAKYAKYTQKVNAKYVRLAWNAYNLNKIYAKFNAKNFRSMLNLTQNA